MSQTLQYATPSPRSDIREIAVRQKALLFCILAYIGCGILNVVLPVPINLIFTLGVLAAMVTGAVFVFMLAIAIYRTGTGIVLGILTLIPIIGLIVLLIVNGKATKILREHGIKVGLLGANPNQIPQH